MSSITGLDKAQILTYLTAAHVKAVPECNQKSSKNLNNLQPHETRS